MAANCFFDTPCSRPSASATAIAFADRSDQSTSVGISACSRGSITWGMPSETVSAFLAPRPRCRTSFLTVMGARPTLAMSHMRWAPGAERSSLSRTATVSRARARRASSTTRPAAASKKTIVHVCSIADAPWLDGFPSRSGSHPSAPRRHLKCRKGADTLVLGPLALGLGPSSVLGPRSVLSPRSSSPGLGSGRRTDELHRIANAHDPARDDAGAEAAEAGVFGLVDAAEAALQKRAGDLGTGRGVAGDQQAHSSDLQGRARTEGGPVDPRNGE